MKSLRENNFNRRSFLTALANVSLVSAVPTRSAVAQQPFTGQMRIVVPYAAGGTGDIISRLIAKSMSSMYGQNVLVDNKAGAGGHIGAEYVARSKPDGLTLLFGAVGTRAAFSATRNLRYDPVSDLRPVILLAESPHVLIVNATSPARTTSEFIALAKSKPNMINFGSAGLGTSTHLVGELFKLTADVRLNHIPFKGSASAMSDLMGGHIQAMFENLPAAVSFIKAGQVRALSVTSGTRSTSLPEVPTIAESGLPNFAATSWFTIDVASGTPSPIVRKLSVDIGKIIAAPELAPRWQELGLTILGGSTDTASDFLKKETRIWTDLIRVAKVGE